LGWVMGKLCLLMIVYIEQALFTRACEACWDVS